VSLLVAACGGGSPSPQQPGGQTPATSPAPSAPGATSAPAASPTGGYDYGY